jgi:hypothetical protein
VALDMTEVNRRFQAYLRLGASRDSARRRAEAESGETLREDTYAGRYEGRQDLHSPAKPADSEEHAGS